MSFVYSFFFNTPAERESAAALKNLAQDYYQSQLKEEYQKYETEYDQTVRLAEQEFKRAKLEAKETKDRNQIQALMRGVETITQSDVYLNSPETSKAKFEKLRSWIDYAALKVTDGHWDPDTRSLSAFASAPPPAYKN